MTKRKAILHIGTPKTGTTSIQDVLSANRAELIKFGFAYPEVPGKRAHVSLGAFMWRAGGKPLRELESYTGPTDKLGEEIQAELDKLPTSVGTVIFSAEHAWNQGFAGDAVPALYELMKPMFSSFRVIVYLRRQDDKAVSLFSQALRRGAMPASPLPKEPKQRLVFDYEAGLKPWVETFGRASIDVRMFERSAMRGGDVVSDFLSAVGVPELHRPAVSENTSLTSEAQEFLRLLNRVPRSSAAEGETVTKKAPTTGPRPSAHLRKFLVNTFPGRGMMPSRAEAEAFYRSFEAGNERVRAMFFPERPKLFDEDFSKYPEDPTLPAADSVLTVAVSVARMQASIIAELQAEREVGRAHKALAKGNRSAMLGRYIKALLRDPENKAALDGLTEVVETPDEIFRARHFLTGSRVPAALKEAAMLALDARFGSTRLVSPAVAARKAERKANRLANPEAARRRDGAERRPAQLGKRKEKAAKPAKAKRRNLAASADRGVLEQPTH